MTHDSRGAEEAAGHSDGRARWLALTVVMLLSAGYMAHFMDRGWIPHDEGALAQSAERVLAGELPHRDFVDGYTGGLSYLHALAFKAFGTQLLALRYVLFAAFLAWVLVFHQVAYQLLPRIRAAVVTLVAVVWSVPNYPAAMPSWYILFLATGALAALLKYVETSRRRWVALAGLAGGVAVLMKTPGLMILAAGALFLFYHEAQTSAGSPDSERGGALLQVGIGAVLAAAILSLLVIGASRKTWLDVYQFSLPCGAMVGLVARRVYRTGLPSRAVCRNVVRAFTPFAIGAASPLAAFVAYYAAAGALQALVQDIFVLPSKTLVGASFVPPLPGGVLLTAAAGFVAFDFRTARGWIQALQGGIGVAAVVLMLVPRTALALEPLMWASFAQAAPLVLVLLAVRIASRERHDAPSRITSRQILVGSFAAFCSLVQYPFAAPIYFAYSLPLLLLALVELIHASERVRVRALQGIAGAYLMYGALYVTPMRVPGLLGPIAHEDVEKLDLPRGGLVISRQEATSYDGAVRLLRAHGRSGVMFAGPDAPEIYFLAAMRNPTPAMFDYLVSDSLFHLHLVQRLDSLQVDAVAIKNRVWHSPPLAADILDSLARRYPASHTIGDLTVRWR